MAATGELRIKIFSNDQVVSTKVCELVTEHANKAIAERGIFTVAVSGGSLAKFLCNGLPDAKTDWAKWRVFFCDERHVAFDDKECTYTFYKDNLMSKVPLSEENVFRANPNVTVEEDAKEYIDKLKRVFPNVELPSFDMLLLGMGPDGHTCSLFPGHPLLEEKNVWVAPIKDSPKPPPERITFTFPILLNTRCAVFASCGAGKAEMVKQALEGTVDPPLPASRVRPHSGDTYWFLDEPAASLLKK